jgi:DNA-binding transcriptional regulator YiaG
MNPAKLREARATLGLSQQKLAELINTSRRNWQDWEYGVTPCPGPVGCLVRLLLHYKGAADWLARNT